MKIVSFNINGLRARLEQLQSLIDAHQPDIIGLQEIKVHDEVFPVADIEAKDTPPSIMARKPTTGLPCSASCNPMPYSAASPTTSRMPNAG